MFKLLGTSCQLPVARCRVPDKKYIPVILPGTWNLVTFIHSSTHYFNNIPLRIQNDAFIVTVAG
jgi:hypothetical protein